MQLPKEQIRPGSQESQQLLELLRIEAEALGLDRLGVARPEPRPDPRPLNEWIERGLHAGMTYMERWRDLRLDPERFFPGIQSIVCTAVNYYVPDAETNPAQAPVGDLPGGADQGSFVPVGPAGALAEPASVPAGSARVPVGPARAPVGGLQPRVSRYARGRDYHAVIRDKLQLLLASLREWVPDVRGRVAVDTAPVLERYWAERAGVGWIGRNGCLIVPGLGSWVFLGEIFLDVPLPAGRPLQHRCGTCRRCLQACPTGALIESGRLDARRCISYWTVEHRGKFLPETPRISPWLLGCDWCQEVCPWNRFARETLEPALRPVWGGRPRDLGEWEELKPEEFDRHLARTPMERIGFEGLVRNIRRLAEEKREP